VHEDPRIARRLAPTLVLIVTAALLAVGLPRGASAADPAADIPGIPLPGSIATGHLGGPVYDVVYRVSVPPGVVILLSLTGSAGTDYDLYLFDSSAAMVAGNQGVVAQSIGPTSSERLSYASVGGGTYYIDLNGSTNVEGTFTLSVQVVEDATRPTLSVGVAGGRTVTNASTVTVDLAASAVSGISDMAFSDDGSRYGAWVPFAPSFAWTLPPGDGLKTLWIQVRNGVGIESSPVAAQVTLDTRPPEISQTSPPAYGAAPSLRPVFAIRFDEAIDASTWLHGGLIVQAVGGPRVTGSSAYDAATFTGSFTPSSDLLPGAPYVVALGQVRDLAGNVIEPPGTWFVTPLRPTMLRLAAAPPVVTEGATARLTLASAGVPGAAIVRVEHRAWNEADFSPLAEATGGTLAATLQPAANGWYRASYAGDGSTAPATVQLQVLVRRRIAIVGGTTSLATARRGSTVKLLAAASSPIAGLAVTFRLYRYDGLTQRYVYLRTFSRSSDATGMATLNWGTSTGGRFGWRVAVASTPDHANGISALYDWFVR
jgi:hypothetical protein